MIAKLELIQIRRGSDTAPLTSHQLPSVCINHGHNSRLPLKKVVTAAVEGIGISDAATGGSQGTSG